MCFVLGLFVCEPVLCASSHASSLVFLRGSRSMLLNLKCVMDTCDWPVLSLVGGNETAPGYYIFHRFLWWSQGVIITNLKVFLMPSKLQFVIECICGEFMLYTQNLSHLVPNLSSSWKLFNEDWQWKPSPSPDTSFLLTHTPPSWSATSSPAVSVGDCLSCHIHPVHGLSPLQLWESFTSSIAFSPISLPTGIPILNTHTYWPGP